MSGDKFIVTRRHNEFNNSHATPKPITTFASSHFPLTCPPPLKIKTETLILTSKPKISHDSVDIHGGDLPLPSGSPPPSLVPIDAWCLKMEVNENVHPIQLLLHILGIFLSIGTIWSSVKVAISYYEESHIVAFCCTVVLLVVNGFLVTGFSAWWYWVDHLVYGGTCMHQKRSVVQIIVGVFLHCCLMPTLFRNAELLYHTWKVRTLPRGSPRRHQHYTFMVYDAADVGWLKIISATCESALLLLQLYVMLDNPSMDWNWIIWWRIVSAILCWFSFCFTLGNYHRALRLSRRDKANMSLPALCVYVWWKMFVVAPRFLALALFASLYHWWAFVVLGFHWTVMMVAVRLQRTGFCTVYKDGHKPENHVVKEFIFNALLAWVYLFDYVCAREGRNRVRYLLYYGLVYVENLALLGAWFVHSQDPHHTGTPLAPSFPHIVQPPALRLAVKCILVGVVAGLWWVGIALMLLYYLRCHPSRSIPICISLSEWRELLRPGCMSPSYQQEEDPINTNGKEEIHVVL